MNCQCVCLLVTKSHNIALNWLRKVFKTRITLAAKLDSECTANSYITAVTYSNNKVVHNILNEHNCGVCICSGFRFEALQLSWSFFLMCG